MPHPEKPLTIRLGQSHEIIDLRHEILRFGLPRELAHFEGDDEPDTRHFIAETDGQIIACATLLRREWNKIPAWQLRGMAVAEREQGRGVGAILLAEIERLAREEGYSNQFWCNARVSAIPFYEKRGWRITSGEFFVEHAGMHVKMQKRLTN